MKKFLFIAAAALAMVSCSKDSEVIPSVENGKQNAIGFQVTKQNMGRANTTVMQNTHFNFGVWAYKNNDNAHDIMANYLVGYFGQSQIPPVGYDLNATATFNESLTPGGVGAVASLWGYEGLGYDEYPKTGSSITSGCYDPLNSAHAGYFSNHKTQFVRYFDHTSTHTYFYAYAPYIQGAKTPTFTYNGATNVGDAVMTFPEGSIVDGYNDPTKYEYLCASTKIAKENYDEAVSLSFMHMNAKIKIVFYEVIAGYDVKMLPLHADAGIIAVPATYNAGTQTYSYGTNLMKTAGATVTFTGSTLAKTLSNFTATTNYTGAAGDAISAADIYSKALVFRQPVATKLADKSAAAKADAHSYSQDVYYGIPNTAGPGLTFRVSFELTSTTGETIQVYDAGAFVDPTYCHWEAGKEYTYIFKITKNTNGSTDVAENHPKVNPTPGDKALYPIVFDGLTVEDWTPAADVETPIN